MGRRRNTPKAKKANGTKVSYELIPREAALLATANPSAAAMYELLDELVEEHHGHLRPARIAIAWCTSWRSDPDGRVVIGKCKRASDLDRELAEVDFVILLSRFFWEHASTTEIQRRALLDHELMHAAPKMGADGEQVCDERGRLVWRTRKHDWEEFVDVVRWYGCYRHELEQFAAVALRAPLPDYEPCAMCRSQEDGTRPGWRRLNHQPGAPLDRCTCYVAWQKRCADLQAAKAASIAATVGDADQEPDHDEDDDFQGVLPEPGLPS